MAARSKAWVCGSLPAETVGSNPTGGMDVCCVCCLLSGGVLCDELITPPEESYRLWCVVVCDLELVNEEALADWGLWRQIKKIMHVAVCSELSACMYHTVRRYAPEDGYIHCASNLFPAKLIKSDKSDFTIQIYIYIYIYLYIHSFSSLSYDRSKASSKASSPHSAIQSFLFQMRVSSPFLKVIQ